MGLGKKICVFVIMKEEIKFCKETGKSCKRVQELSLLFEISEMLNQTPDIKEALNPIMEEIAAHIGLDRVILTVLNRNTSSILIEVAYGLSEKEIRRGSYKIGEGIIGKVVQKGKPVIIPKISDHPDFLNKTGARTTTFDNKDISFICVPIKSKEKIIGTLSINRTYYQNISYEQDLRLLTIIGTMIARSVRSRQDRLEELERLQQENDLLQDKLRQKVKHTTMVGSSGKMQEVYNLVAKVAATNTTVLIRGESGVGKELVAEAIHQASPRSEKPLIKINCSALPESLIESELFGHERGAFTGADALRKGRFELAEGGTIFLDEIGDLPLSTQVKILRILQQKEYERLGGAKTLKANVRVIAATNRDLEKMVDTNEFRLDLFYRLNVFPVHIPALRERKADIPLLVDYFIEKFNTENGTDIKRITGSAIDMLMYYHWPGNIRELENCIERATILSTDGVIRSMHLPPTLQTAESSGTTTSGTLETVLSKVEQQLIIDTLILTKGNLAKAADKLKVTERIIGLRIKKYNIDPGRFKIRKNG